MRARSFVSWLVIVGMLAGSSACEDEPAPIQVVTGPPKGPPAVLEVALVAKDVDDPKAREYEHRGSKVRLVDVRALSVEKAGVSTDEGGAPMLEFELAEPDASRFRAFTREHNGRPLAMLIDEKVMTIATIADELPGVGVMSLWPDATRADVEEMARRLMAKR